MQIPVAMLFPSTRSGRSRGRVAQYSVAKLVLASAIVPDTERGRFKLRHTFAQQQLRRAAGADQVAQWMGLADSVPLSKYRKILMTPPAGIVLCRS